MQSQKLDLSVISTYLNQISALPQKNVLICVSGPTGSGKSTLINYLLNNQMIFQKKYGNYAIMKAQETCIGPKISNTNISGTTYPEAYNWKYGLSLIDWPGTKDTRGPEADILSAIAISQCLVPKARAKFVVVISIHNLNEGRGIKYMTDHFKPFYELLNKDFSQGKDSLSFCVTQLSPEISEQDVYEKLEDMFIGSQHLFPEQVIQILMNILKTKRVFLFNRPDHPSFEANLQHLRVSLERGIPSFQLKNKASLALTASAQESVRRYQSEISGIIINYKQGLIREILNQSQLFKYRKLSLKDTNQELDKVNKLYSRLSGVQKLAQKDYDDILTILLKKSKYIPNPQYKEFVEEYFSSWPILQSIISSQNNEEITKGMDIKIFQAIREYLAEGK